MFNQNLTGSQQLHGGGLFGSDFNVFVTLISKFNGRSWPPSRPLPPVHHSSRRWQMPWWTMRNRSGSGCRNTSQPEVLNLIPGTGKENNGQFARRCRYLMILAKLHLPLGLPRFYFAHLRIYLLFPFNCWMPIQNLPILQWCIFMPNLSCWFRQIQRTIHKLKLSGSANMCAVS